MQSDSADLLWHFSQLRSKQARQAALHGLVSLLHPDEWRDLRDHLSDRHFKCDILGSLPVEVVAQVVKYLGLSDIVLLQRVSKRWHSLLCSPLVQSTAIHHRCGVPLSMVDSAGSSFLKYARHRIMLERGQPFSSVQYRVPRDDSREPPIMDYARGYCAWVDVGNDGHCRGIQLRDLRSGVLQRFYSENRDLYEEVRVSDTIVAAVSVRGFCHVWNHRDQENASFRLPSLQFGFFLASGKKVAFGFTECVVAWDFRARITHRVNVVPGMLYMALDSSGDTVTVVHPSRPNCKDIDPTTLQISKYPLEGSTHPNPLSSSTLPIPQSPRPDVVLDTNFIMSSFISDLTRCNNRTGVLALRSAQLLPLPSYVLFISHDRDSDRLSLHALNHKHAYNDSFVSVGCNILYYLVPDAPRIHVGVSNPHDVPAFRSSRFMGVNVRHAHESPYCSLYGDGEFVLLLHEDGLTVWCFEDSAPIAGACPVEPLT